MKNIPPGPPGLPGRDGKDGKDGSDGKDGKDGKDGNDGNDAPPPPPNPPAPPVAQQAQRDDAALNRLFNLPPPPPPPASTNASFAAQVEHENRVRDLERQAEQERLIEAKRQQENRANIAESIAAGLAASLTDAHKKAQERAVAAQIAMQQQREAQSLRQQAHEAELERIRREAERPAPTPQRFYIAERSGRGVIPGDVTRTRAAKRKADTDLGQPSRASARTGPPPASNESETGNLQPIAGVMNLDLPTTLGPPSSSSKASKARAKAEPKRRAGYVPGDTSSLKRAPAQKRKKPDSELEERPKKPRRDGIVKTRVRNIETVPVPR